MTRKTKVRIVGDPELCKKVANILEDAFVMASKQEFPRAPTRYGKGSDAPGYSIYFDIKRPKRGSELEETP